MKNRRLGNSVLEVSPLAFGGNVFGWTVDEQKSFTLLDAFVDAGFNFIDTADVYSKWFPGNQGGESESILGKWFKRSGKRTKVILATKVGKEMGPNQKGLSKTYIFRAVEDSLQRLRTDYIDLYQSHCDDADTPMEETLAAYGQLIQQGKIRVIGASNFGAERLLQALQVSRQKGYPGYQSLQPFYNLYDRAEYETKIEPLCREKGLSVISYFSLASGFLTGKYRSEKDLAGSARGQRVGKYLNERGFRVLEALDRVARERGAAPATISLAWLMARPSITAPIASATSLEQLRHLVKAPELELDHSEIEMLNQASAY
jgi:aryl-alcohol dehydrogenase-like predicted oxidoreductase